jgi:class 3 adenylate cyclase/TolB-like protein/ketosteroid isomerase-like protein
VVHNAFGVASLSKNRNAERAGNSLATETELASNVYSRIPIVYKPSVPPPADERPTEPDETFTRRVCAVLLADVSGFTALMGIDDEGTARAVQRLQALIQEIVAEAKGRADAFAGDAIFAIFDSVVAAVDAALNIQGRIAAHEFEGRRLQVRMGVHYGDVLLREGTPLGTAVGDAINVAARLQGLAKPGTICISDGVYRQVRNKFDEKFVDLGRQQLKNISEPVHAYLIVPRNVLEAHGPHRSILWPAIAAAAAAMLVTLGIVIGLRHWGGLSRGAPRVIGLAPATRGSETVPAPGALAGATPEVSQVTLGVMLFKRLGGGDEKDWRREALRDGLNAQLSQLSQVKVYSKEFIDFLMSRKGLTDVEAAEQLGIKKMLSGSYIAVGGTLRVETHIVDVATGVMEASYTTIGPEQDFLDLQNKLAFGVISNLNLPVTEAEKRTLLAKQTTNVDALKMLLEAEGGSAPPTPGPRSKSPTLGPSSALARWLAVAESVSPAFGAQDNADQTEILAVLERYRKATEAKQMQGLAAVYSEFSPEQQAAQQRYFENVRDLKVAIDNVDIAVVGDEAVVSYTRTDDFADARTGRPMHVAVRLTKILRRQDGQWKLAGGK